MKTFSIPVLSFALLSAAPLLADTPAAPQAPPTSTPAATATGKDSIPSAESLVNQSLSLMINIQQTLAAAQDKESADKAAKTLEGIQKDIKHFQDIMNKLNDAEQEKAFELFEKMEERGKRLEKSCKQEGKRLVKADFYNSTALKDVMNNSDEFSELIEQDEEEGGPAAGGDEQDEE
ncbi:MAG: hypothetical protein LUE13_05805 [Akkermansiaceae bacterium]|nr:hypothetical protein [Akkermansiaceae bacterium]